MLENFQRSLIDLRMAVLIHIGRQKSLRIDQDTIRSYCHTMSDRDVLRALEVQSRVYIRIWSRITSFWRPRSR